MMCYDIRNLYSELYRRGTIKLNNNSGFNSPPGGFLYFFVALKKMVTKTISYKMHWNYGLFFFGKNKLKINFSDEPTTVI